MFDHVNNDGLDCTKANLRPATTQQNTFNTRKASGATSSRFKGVTKGKRETLWRACIVKAGERHELGRYTDETDAARAYDAAARRLFGEFAKTNVDLGLLPA